MEQSEAGMVPNMPQLDNEIDIAISKLHIEDGDFVIVRISDRDSGCQHSVVQSLSKGIVDTGKHNVMVCCLDKADSVSSLNEWEMAQNGWFRKPPAVGREGNP